MSHLLSLPPPATNNVSLTNAVCANSMSSTLHQHHRSHHSQHHHRHHYPVPSHDPYVSASHYFHQASIQQFGGHLTTCSTTSVTNGHRPMSPSSAVAINLVAAASSSASTSVVSVSSPVDSAGDSQPPATVSSTSVLTVMQQSLTTTTTVVAPNSGPQSASNSHLGTMYATKRRRRNSKNIRLKDGYNCHNTYNGSVLSLENGNSGTGIANGTLGGQHQLSVSSLQASSVVAGSGQTKTNPSKRHRERLNSELDMLASLLPFEQSVLSKLDKLSILRLSVSYLRTKSYFQSALRKDREAQLQLQQQQQQQDGTTKPMNGYHSDKGYYDTATAAAHLHHVHHHHVHHHHHHVHHVHFGRSSPSCSPSITEIAAAAEALMESDLILQALNGFLLILTCDGEVFYTSHTVETYLGFHQSDICHQSVYELVHSEDREELQRHLMWNTNLPTDRSNIKLQEMLQIENSHLLERNFTVRFRCLLDNTSGFLRLDVRGRIKVLYGQNHKSEDPPMALFAVCTPFGPPSLLEMPANEKALFKSKHKLDFSLVSMDARGRALLGYSETELSNRGGYDLIHHDDLFYVASAHQELLKTGASGLIAYRLVSKDCVKWQWLQTSARLVYKNSKPDFILCTHRPLMEEEGRDLLSKRTMDFKVTYLDGGLGAITVNRTTAATTNGQSPSSLVESKSSATETGSCAKTRSKSDRNRQSRNSTPTTSTNSSSSSSITATAKRTPTPTGKCDKRVSQFEVVSSETSGRRVKPYSKAGSATKQHKQSPKGGKLKPTSHSSSSSSNSSLGSFDSGGFQPAVELNGSSTAAVTTTSSFQSSSSDSFAYSQSHNNPASGNADVGRARSHNPSPSASTSSPPTSVISTYGSWAGSNHPPPPPPYLMDDGVHLSENMFHPHHAHHTHPHHHHHHQYSGAAAAAAAAHHLSMGGPGNSAAAAAAAAAAVAYSAYHHSNYPHQTTTGYLSTSGSTGDTYESSATEVTQTNGPPFLTTTTTASIRANPFFSAENLLHYSSRHSLNQTYPSAATSGNDIYAVAAAIHHGQRNQYLAAAAGGSSSTSGNGASAYSYPATTYPGVQQTGGSFHSYNSAEGGSEEANNGNSAYLRANPVPSLVASDFASFDTANSYRFGPATAYPNDPYTHHSHHLKSSPIASLTNGSENGPGALGPYGSTHLTSINAVAAAAASLTPAVDTSSFFNGSNRLPALGPNGASQQGDLLSANFNVHPLWNGLGHLGHLTSNRPMVKDETVAPKSDDDDDEEDDDEDEDSKNGGYFKKRKSKHLSSIDQLSISLPNSSSGVPNTNPMSDTPPASSSSTGSASIVDELSRKPHDSPDLAKHSLMWNSLITSSGGAARTPILVASTAKLYTQQQTVASGRTSECFLSPSSSTATSSPSSMTKLDHHERITPTNTDDTTVDSIKCTPVTTAASVTSISI